MRRLESLNFDELFSGDALILGGVKFRGFAAAWPSRSDEHGFTDRMHLQRLNLKLISFLRRDTGFKEVCRRCKA
jgi:hypothetical protein